MKTQNTKHKTLKRINNPLFIMSFMALLVFTPNCKKETDFTKHTGHSASQFAEKEMIVLGEQLENPYSVENMQIAYNSLKDNETTLSPTHLYIRYLPADDTEYQILKDDQELELFDYPLDYEMEEGGLSYHDPNLPETAITWQYTAVEIGYTFANVEYEIIDSLIIPEFYEEESFTPEFLAQLEREAFRITGNLEEGMIFSHNTELPSKWTPQGTIEIYDNIVNSSIPLGGVKVRARSWFKIKTVFTNGEGEFETDEFRWDVRYSIKWETPDYDIRNGRVWQAYYTGPKQTGPWNLDIVNGGWKSLRFGTIHRAAHRYHYGEIDGLKRTGLPNNLKIKYIDTLNYARFLHQGGNPAVNQGINGGSIKIWKGGSFIAPVDKMYSTTIHEIAHTSHKMLIGNWIGTDDLIIESWAAAVDWHLTKLEYASLGKHDYDTPDLTSKDRKNHQQYWLGEKNYSPIFIDLVDDFNQALKARIKEFDSEGKSFFTNPLPIYCKLGTLDPSENCYIETAPQGETSHIATYGSNYAIYFYYTPIGCCSCPVPSSYSHNSNTECRMGISIPLDVVPFVLDTKMYVRPHGTDKYPYDEFTGLSLKYIEANILSNVKNINDLRLEIITHKPSSVNPNVIYNLFDENFYAR